MLFKTLPAKLSLFIAFYGTVTSLLASALVIVALLVKGLLQALLFKALPVKSSLFIAFNGTVPTLLATALVIVALLVKLLTGSPLIDQKRSAAGFELMDEQLRSTVSPSE